MCIRQATHTDFQIIRTLPVQLTPRTVTALKPKHFRVLFQENNVRLLVNEGKYMINAFMALRFMPAMDSAIRFLVIVHLALERHALRANIAAHMEAHAVTIAEGYACAGLLVQAKPLSEPAIGFFRGRGYELETETLIKRI